MVGGSRLLGKSGTASVSDLRQHPGEPGVGGRSQADADEQARHRARQGVRLRAAVDALRDDGGEKR